MLGYLFRLPGTSLTCGACHVTSSENKWEAKVWFTAPPEFFFFTKSTPKRTWGHNFATVNHVETKLCKCHHKHDVPVSSDHNHIDMSKYEWITAVYTWVKFDNVCHRRNGLLFSYSNWTQQFPATDIKHVMILDYLFSEGRYATVAVLQYNHNGNDNILFSGDQKIGLFWFFVAYKVVKYNTFPRWPFWASAILNVVLKWWIYWLHWLIITKLGIRLLHNAMKVIKTFRGSATVLPKSIMQFYLFCFAALPTECPFFVLHGLFFAACSYIIICFAHVWITYVYPLHKSLGVQQSNKPTVRFVLRFMGHVSVWFV